MSRSEARTDLVRLLFIVVVLPVTVGLCMDFWPAISAFLTRPASLPWWAYPLALAVALLAFLGFLLWLELRRPDPWQRECCTDHPEVKRHD